MEELKTKSQKKREATYLQKIGVQLIALSLEKLERLPLPVSLYHAILEAKSIKSHGAARRQAQLIGKLMRSSNHEAIIETYEAMMAESRAQTSRFHELEQWRERLIHGGQEALTEFVNDYQPDDIQKLRQLIKKAIDEQSNNKHTGATKALFRFLRSCVK